MDSKKASDVSMKTQNGDEGHLGDILPNPEDSTPPKSNKAKYIYYGFVAFIFVFSGSMSTLASKWTDNLKVRGMDGTERVFNHPFFQTWLMFMGEYSCMLAFQASVLFKRFRGIPLEEGKDYRKPVTCFIFLLTACCDFTATTMMYYGLTMTEASVYQMLRGAVVICTGFFSRVFLKRRFQLYQLLGIFMVTAGLAAVGVSSALFSKKGQTATNPVLGDILVVCAQFVVAGQMVIEEKIMHKWNVPPYTVVGWEGFWGLCLTTTALAIFQAFPTPPDDVRDAAVQVWESWRVILSCFLALLSFPLLNATGQIITKDVSATARMVLDTIRIVVVWVFTLAYTSFFHVEFQWLQLVGFLILICGNAVYRYIIRIPIEICRDHSAEEKVPDEEKRLVSEKVEVAVTNDSLNS